MTRESERKWGLTELAKEINKDSANVLRELGILQEMGLVQVLEAEKKTYHLNPGCPGAAEMRALFQCLSKEELIGRFRRTWMLAEDIPNMCPFFSRIWLNCFVNDFAQPCGRAYERTVAIHRDYHLWFYFDEQDADAVAKHVVQRFSDDPGFMAEVNRQIVYWSDELRAYAEHLPDARLDALPGQEMWNLYAKHQEIHTRYYQWGWIPVAADMFGDQLTEYGKQLLRTRGVSPERLNEILTLFTQPTKSSLLKIEQDNLLAIGERVQADKAQHALFRDLFRKLKEEDIKLFGLYEHTPKYEEHFENMVRSLIEQIHPDILQALRDHYATYFYTKFLFTEEQGVYSFEYYLKSLVRLVSGDADIAGTIVEDRESRARLVEERLRRMQDVGLSRDEQRFFDAWGDFMITKIYRRFAQLFALYRMTPLVEEIGRRLGLSLKETRFMLPEEVQAALLENRVALSDIKKRVAHSVYYADAQTRCFYTGERAQEITTLIAAPQKSLTQEIKGQCGCPGVVRGVVRIVNVVEDMQKLKVGEILVAISTQPDLIPAMKKAAAFVTDQGGVTSHAAIVAREMNKPCVIATKHASKVLKDGMRVEVDANKGVVRVLTDE